MSQTKAQLLDNIKDNVQLDARNSLRFADTDSSHYVAFKAPATVSSNVTWTLPAADGSANYVLATDGSGNLSWIADPAGQWVTSGSNIYFTGGNVGIGDSSPSNPLSVTGASAFNGDVTFTGASYNVTWDKSADDLIFADSAKAVFGTGSDFQIYHDGSNSILENTTGSLYIRPKASEAGISLTPDGAVKVYYDNVKKFETTSSGATVTGDLTVTSFISQGDSDWHYWGDSNDFAIGHNGTDARIVNTVGNIKLEPKSNELGIQIVPDAEVKLYYDGGGTMATTQYGIEIYDELNLYHQSGNSYIKNDTGNLHIGSNGFIAIYGGNDYGEYAAKFINDGAVELYYDNSKTLETTAAGVTVTDNGATPLKVVRSGSGSNVSMAFTNDTSSMYCGLTSGEDWAVDDDADLGSGPMLLVERTTGNVQIPNDTGKIQLGTSQDLQIYHDGNNFIKTSSGYLNIDVGNDNLYLDANEIRLRGEDGGEILAKFIDDGAVELYYDGDKIFNTESYGATLKRPSGGSTTLDIIGCEGQNAVLNLVADDGDDNADHWKIKSTHVGNEFAIQSYAGGSWETVFRGTDSRTAELHYQGGKKFETTSTGCVVSGLFENTADVASNYASQIIHDGANTNRYGLNIQCGADDAAGTNTAIRIADGNGTAQGLITFSGGTVYYGDFSAYHPCIVPDSENPSDSSNAYPYGTLLETTSIEYTQKNGANTERGIRYKVQKTQSANSRKVLGAYGSSMNGGPDGQTNEHQALVLGDGHILVNNAGGNIEVGDGICSSATAGIGQKATANPSMIIGIAQEAVTFTGSETKLVAVQYGLQQFIPWT